MQNLRRFDLRTFEPLFDQVFSTALQQNESISFILQSLFGIEDLSIIVNHFKQFQQRRQCLQKITTYHICETCYNSGVCLCPDCYNPDQHRNHRVTERNGTGYCDCGILKNGCYCNCRNHNPRVLVKENLLEIAFGEDLEYAKELVKIVFKRIIRFVKTSFNDRVQTAFGVLMDSARSLLQAEALYQLFGEVSSEPITDNNGSFFREIYRELNTARSFTDSFVSLFTYQWFVPLAMHPSNYKHYHLIIETDYRRNVSFICQTLLSVYEYPRVDQVIGDIMKYDKNLIIFNDLISFYLHPDILQTQKTNKYLFDGMKVVLSFAKELEKASELCKFANKQMFEYSLVCISKAIGHYSPNCRIIKESDLVSIRDTIFKFMKRASDETIVKMIDNLNPITSKLKNETIQKILEHCFNENRCGPIEGLIMKFAGNKLTLPSVIFTPFENVTNIDPIETSHDFLDLTKLPHQTLTMKMLSECMSVIKFLMEMKDYVESQMKEVNLIEYIEEKYPEIKREMILTLIVWYMNFDRRKISYYIVQRTFYRQIQENVNESKETKPQIRIEDIISRNKMQEKIICNPFVPLTFGYQQNLYLFYCYIGKKVIGNWKGENNIKFLQSTELSALMFETFMNQPLYVIHLLWKRIIFGIKIQSDEIGIMIFSLFSEFLEKYPMWRNEIFKLPIAYEEVTEGSQQTFIESMNQ